MAVIGIALGTTNCTVARCVDGRPEIIMLEGEPTLPSVVSLLKSGKIVVGRTAKRNQVNAPHNTIVEIKRMMGKNVQVPLGGKTFTLRRSRPSSSRRSRSRSRRSLANR